MFFGGLETASKSELYLAAIYVIMENNYQKTGVTLFVTPAEWRIKMNITIRTACPADADALLALYAPYVRDTAITFEYVIPSVREFSARIENTLKKYPYLVAEADGEIVGYAYAGPFKERAAYDWAVESSIYIKMEKRRMGIGARLYEELEEALKTQGILNVNACIAYTNTQDAHLTNDSVAFHERLGYRMVGQFHKCGYKFCHWYDMVWMEKLIGEHLENQPKVRGF